MSFRIIPPPIRGNFRDAADKSECEWEQVMGNQENEASAEPTLDAQSGASQKGGGTEKNTPLRDGALIFGDPLAELEKLLDTARHNNLFWWWARTGEEVGHGKHIRD